MANLDEMAKKAEIAWDHSVQAIRGAVNLMDLGVVHRSSAAAWRADGYLVTKMGGRYDCDCDSRAYNHPTLGKLCHHVIAAMFDERMAKQTDSRSVLSVVQEMTGDGLAIRRHYETNERLIVGYTRGIRIVDHFTPQMYLPVSRNELHEALYSLRWSLSALPRKLSGQEYLYVFGIRKDRSGAELTREIWDMRAVTTYMAERHRQEEFLRHSFEQNLAAAD